MHIAAAGGVGAQQRVVGVIVGLFDTACSWAFAAARVPVVEDDERGGGGGGGGGARTVRLAAVAAVGGAAAPVGYS